MSYKHIFLILTLVFSIQQMTYCQTTFFKTFGDTTAKHYDKGYAVLETEDCSYIVAGEYNRYYVGAPQHYYGDVYLVKTDKYGDTLWTKIYGEDNAWETAYSMDVTEDGGNIISCLKFDSQSWRLWIIKTDVQGDSVWSKAYPVREGNCIRQTTDGGFIITGGFSDIYLLKTNNNGDILWLKEYNNKSEREEGTYVQQTTDGGYIICGITEFPEPEGLDIWLIKTDAQGDTLWTKIYGGDYIDEPHSICETEEGGYFVVGEYTEEGELGLELHIWLLRTDSQGDTLWTKKINNGSWGDYGYSMKNTTDGGFIIVGETIYDSFDSDIYIIKLDKEGNYQWSSKVGKDLGEIGVEKHYRGIDVEETIDGGYIITGSREQWTNSGDYQDLFLLKVNDNGQITDVKKEESKIPTGYILLQNYPNPFNPITTIEYTIPNVETGYIPSLQHIKLSVYDVLGREVAVLVDEKQNVGSYKVEFNGNNLSSGVYFVRLTVGTSTSSATGFCKTIKSLLIK